MWPRLHGTLRLHLVCVDVPGGSVAPSKLFRAATMLRSASSTRSFAGLRSLSCMAIWFWPARILLLRGTDSSLAALACSNSAFERLDRWVIVGEQSSCLQLCKGFDRHFVMLPSTAHLSLAVRILRTSSPPVGIVPTLSPVLPLWPTPSSSLL